jgi:hypothetical protein
MKSVKFQKDYMKEVEGNSDSCPGCDDPDVSKELDLSQSDPGYTDYDCFCDNCNMGWKETYKLTFLGFTDNSFVDEGGEEMEVKEEGIE